MRQISSHLKAFPPTSGCHPVHMDFRIILKEGRKWQFTRRYAGADGTSGLPRL